MFELIADAQTIIYQHSVERGIVFMAEITIEPKNCKQIEEISKRKESMKDLYHLTDEQFEAGLYLMVYAMACGGFEVKNSRDDFTNKCIDTVIAIEEPEFRNQFMNRISHTSPYTGRFEPCEPNAEHQSLFFSFLITELKTADNIFSFLTALYNQNKENFGYFMIIVAKDLLDHNDPNDFQNIINTFAVISKWACTDPEKADWLAVQFITAVKSIKSYDHSNIILSFLTPLKDGFITEKQYNIRRAEFLAYAVRLSDDNTVNNSVCSVLKDILNSTNAPEAADSYAKGLSNAAYQSHSSEKALIYASLIKGDILEKSDDFQSSKTALAYARSLSVAAHFSNDHQICMKAAVLIKKDLLDSENQKFHTSEISTEYVNAIASSEALDSVPADETEKLAEMIREQILENREQTYRNASNTSKYVSLLLMACTKYTDVKERARITDMILDVFDESDPGILIKDTAIAYANSVYEIAKLTKNPKTCIKLADKIIGDLLESNIEEFKAKEIAETVAKILFIAANNSPNDKDKLDISFQMRKDLINHFDSEIILQLQSEIKAQVPGAEKYEKYEKTEKPEKSKGGLFGLFRKK